MDKGMDPATRFKFRAWDPVNSRMYKAPFIAFEPDGTHEAYEDAREWEDCIRRKSILMQWTGLKDRNGVEIYEGDILGWDDKTRPLVVEWRNGGFGYELRRQFVSFAGHGYLKEVLSGCSVIGNIYEHPALLSAPERFAEGSKS